MLNIESVHVVSFVGTDKLLSFWYGLQYARHMESHDVEKSRSAFRRACTIHLPQKASLHLAWAAFEERQGYFICIYFI